MNKMEFEINTRWFAFHGFWSKHGYAFVFTTQKTVWYSRDLKLPKYFNTQK